MDFKPDTYKYIINLPEDCEDIVIKAEPIFKGDIVYINGVQVTKDDAYRSIVDLQYGKNVVKIKVNDLQSSETVEYYLFIYRGGSRHITLDNILMDDAEIGFNPQKNMYNIELDEDDDNIRLQMFLKDKNTTIKVNDVTLNNTNAIKLNFNGVNKYTINVKVIDIDSNMENIYTINIYLGIPVTPEVDFAINEAIKPYQWVIENGRWRYNDGAGNYVKNTWIYDKNYQKYFYFNDRGYMVTGWFNMDNGSRYYFDAHGARQTGWVKISDSWYYFNDIGVMRTGWVFDKGKWYYLDKNGMMKCGWIYDRGNWYYLNSDGSMKTGWIIYKKQYYYLTENGNAYAGWLYYNNKWYYMQPETCEMVYGQWLKYKGSWYYINYDGTMRTGWLYKDNKYYYLNETGRMNTEDKVIDGYRYHFNRDGSADI